MVCSIWRKEVQIPFLWQDTKTSLSKLQIALDTMGFLQHLVYQRLVLKGFRNVVFLWILKHQLQPPSTNKDPKSRILLRCPKVFLVSQCPLFAFELYCDKSTQFAHGYFPLLKYPYGRRWHMSHCSSVWIRIQHETLGTWKGPERDMTFMRTPIWDVSDVCVVLANNTLRSVEAMPV